MKRLLANSIISKCGKAIKLKETENTEQLIFKCYPSNPVYKTLAFKFKIKNGRNFKCECIIQKNDGTVCKTIARNEAEIYEIMDKYNILSDIIYKPYDIIEGNESMLLTLQDPYINNVTVTQDFKYWENHYTELAEQQKTNYKIFRKIAHDKCNLSPNCTII
jgi:hypothetical protein